MKAFIIPQRRERYVEFVRNPRRRATLIAELAHFKALNPKFMVGIRPSQQHPAGILKLLKAKGAGIRCWVVSENATLDGR